MQRCGLLPQLRSNAAPRKTLSLRANVGRGTVVVESAVWTCLHPCEFLFRKVDDAGRDRRRNFHGQCGVSLASTVGASIVANVLIPYC